MANEKILVVDDDKNICELLRLYLVKEGYNVTMVHDGGAALAEFDKLHPDLVLLDVMMPVMDGWEVCRKIRAKDNTPIIMLTAKGETYDKVLGKKVGGKMKELAAAIGRMTQNEIAQMEQDGTFTLCDYALTAEDVEIITEDMPGWLVANNGVLTIALDIELTEALVEEGVARELINRIQNLRKSSGLEITDRIEVSIENREEVAGAVSHCNEYIASQVLATSLTLADGLTDGTEVEKNS